MKPGLLTVVTALLSAVGCATYGYHVDRDEARRVVEEIRERAEVVVTATRVDSSERVRLRLSRTDQVSLVTRAKGSTGSVVVKGPDQLVNLATDAATVDSIDFEETRRGGAMAIAIGAPLTVIAVVVGGAFAAWTEYGFAAVPVVGPTAYAIHRGQGKALLLSAFEALPIGLLIAGLVASRPTHEVDDEAAMPSSTGRWPAVTFAPTPNGGAGLQVLGTF